MIMCEEVRFSLGVYVLGGLEPADRITVDAHVGSCPNCRDELAGLAGMPALLGRVSEGQIAQVAEPPSELLDSLLGRAAAERPGPGRGLRGFGRWATLAAAAAVLLLVGALFGGLLTGGSETSLRAVPPVTASPSASPSPSALRPPAEKLSAADTRSGISAQLIVRDYPTGTRGELHLKGVPAGTRCRLDAVTRNGRRDSLGSWAVKSEGYTGFYGSSMWRRDQVSSFEIVTDDGRTLLTIRA